MRALISPGWGSTLNPMRIAAALLLVLALASPALAETTAAAAARDKVIDALYDRLAKAKTDDEAKGISGALERAQLRSGSDTADLLMTRALTAIQAGNSEVAVEILTSIVKLDPDFTEAWNKRATLYYLKNDYARSMADIAETLKRDPRHFGAWAGLGMILRETGDKKRAYEAFKHALAINPHLDTVQKALDELKPDVEGRDI
jgi:tetratricopeptide (TPR) repeat protein